MRIALIIYGSLDIRTGGFLYDRKIVEYLRANGVDVQVVPLPWRSYPLHLTDNFKRGFVKRVRDLHPDIVIQDELNHPSLFLLNRLLRRSVSAPIVSIVHHLRSDEQRSAMANRMYRIIEREYLRNIDAFIFNSDTTRASVEQLVGSGKPYVRARPGRPPGPPQVSREEALAKARSEGPLQVMFVGSLIRRKELHTLILAAGLIPSDQLHIDVIGNPEAEPEYTRYVKTLIKDTGREGTIHLRGALSNEELHRYYRVAGLLAVPSSYEGFGIVYLEGMGFGLPAIASNTGAAHEVVTDGVNGYLPPPGDAHAIAECLRALINNRDLRIRLSLAALDRYQSHCTWDETAQNVHAFLKSLVLPS